MNMFKLVLGAKNKIVKLKNAHFQQLKKEIEKTFNNLPADYCLSYLDQDRDEICLNSDEDLSVLMSIGAKINKIFIKESLSQVIQIENTQKIEPSFNENISFVNDTSIDDVSTQKIQFYGDFMEEVHIEKKDVLHQEILSEEIKVQDKVLQENTQQTQKRNVFKNIFFSKREQVEQVNIQQQNKAQKIEQIAKQQIKEVNEQVIFSNSNLAQIKIIEDIKDQIQEKIQVIAIQQQMNVQKQQIKQVQSIVAVDKIKEQQIKKQIPNDNAIVEKKKQEIKQQVPINVIPIMDKKALIKEPIIVEQQPIRKPILQIEDNAPYYKRYSKNVQIQYHKVVCSGCKDDYGIIGIRYQCIICDNYNLCERCQGLYDHDHSLVKVKIASRDIKKEDIVKKYRKEIYGPIQPQNNVVPQGYYVPSINKEQALGFIKAAEESFAECLQRNKRLMNDMYLKLEMSHKNPYEMMKKSKVESPAETLKQKVAYLLNLFDIQQRQATYYCDLYKNCTKERIVELYLQKNQKKF